MRFMLDVLSTPDTTPSPTDKVEEAMRKLAPEGFEKLTAALNDQHLYGDLLHMSQPVKTRDLAESTVERMFAVLNLYPGFNGRVDMGKLEAFIEKAKAMSPFVSSTGNLVKVIGHFLNELAGKNNNGFGVSEDQIKDYLSDKISLQLASAKLAGRGSR